MLRIECQGSRASVSLQVADMAVVPMQIKNVLVTGLRLCAVCLLFDFCMAAGAALSGLNRVAQQSGPAPGDLVVPLLIFSLCVGASVSYLILRSKWHGWTLASAMFLAIYGFSTVATQVETLFFLSNKLPAGMARALFLQGAISTLLFAPLAVLVLGKWREQTSAPDTRALARPRTIGGVESRTAYRGFRLPLHVVWLLCGMAKPGTARVLRRPELAHVSCGAERKLGELAGDLCARGVPRCALHCVRFPAASNAASGTMGVRRSSGAVYVCVDHGAAAAQPFDAAERRAQPFRGDVGIQPGIRLASRVASEPCVTEHC